VTEEAHLSLVRGESSSRRCVRAAGTAFVAGALAVWAAGGLPARAEVRTHRLEVTSRKASPANTKAAERFRNRCAFSERRSLSPM